MKRTIIAAMALAAAGTAARADEPTEAQTNVIRHLIDAKILVAKCPGTKVNALEAEALTVRYDIPENAFAAGGPYEAVARRIARSEQANAEHLTTYQACHAAILMYGPKGGNVPNLILQGD